MKTYGKATSDGSRAVRETIKLSPHAILHLDYITPNHDHQSRYWLAGFKDGVMVEMQGFNTRKEADKRISVLKKLLR
jgi:hypothetical protein